MRVHVVIPATGWSQLLEQCLASVAASGHPPQLTTVVFDGRADVPTELHTAASPAPRTLCRAEAGGFGAACNSAIRSLSTDAADVVLFLNDDARLPAEWTGAMRHFANPQVGVVGFSEQRPDGSRRRYPYDLRAGARVQRGPTLAGCAFAVPLRLLRLLGGFDESYRMYGEETDLFARLQRLGYVLVEDDCPVWHHDQGTVGSRPVWRTWLSLRNPLRYALLNEPARACLRTVLATGAQVLSPTPAPFADEPHVARRRALPPWVRLPLAAGALTATLGETPRLLLLRRRARGGIRQGDLESRCRSER